MIHALGYAQNDFNPYRPGRLCRGRERWIEPWPSEDQEGVKLQRLVISGAVFEDESASGALRGVPHSQVDLASLITTLFPRKPMLAFMEDGHVADIPDDAEHVELYDGYRAGGRTVLPLVRWVCQVSGVKKVRELLETEGREPVRGFLVLHKDTDVEVLVEKLFLLLGMATLDSPPAQYQPAALPELLELVSAVVLLHRDKHGPALGVYTLDPLGVDAKLEGLCAKADALLVPFAIPPMLARWDRALGELRAVWSESHEEPFPVPEAPEGATWQRGRRRRGRKGKREAEASDVDLDDETSEEESDDTTEDEGLDDASEEVEPAPKRRAPKKPSGEESVLDDLDALLTEE